MTRLFRLCYLSGWERPSAAPRPGTQWTKVSCPKNASGILRSLCDQLAFPSPCSSQPDARRRGLSAAEHALLSNLAASSITRLAAFKAGARVAVYLPFDRETNTAALLVAARRRRVRIFVPVVEICATAVCASTLVGQDAARRVRHFGAARRRAPPDRRAALVRSDRRAPGGRRLPGPPPGNGRRILRSRARLPACTGSTGWARAWSGSPSSASASNRMRGAARRAPGFAGNRARQIPRVFDDHFHREAFLSKGGLDEPLASQVRTRHLQHR